jgi:hypothetical protein
MYQISKCVNDQMRNNKMNITINDVNQTIMFGNFTDEQLSSVLQAVKYRRKQLIRENRSQLTVGSTAEFVTRGRTVVGEVVKINPKYVHVRETINGVMAATTWKVPGNMLKIVRLGS